MNFKRVTDWGVDATPTGWTEIYTKIDLSNSWRVYAHIADSVNDDFVLDWVFPGSGSREFSVVYAFTGSVYTDLGTIVLDSDFVGGTWASIPLPATTTPSEDNCLLLAFAAHMTINNPDHTETITTIPPEWSDTLIDYHSGTSQMDIAFGQWIQTTATAYDGDNFLYSGSVTSRYSTGNVLTLRPATGPDITDVNGTESWTDGDTNLVITGTGFNAT